MSADGHAPLSTLLDIRPVAGRIGAEVAGVSLSADLSDAAVQAIETALHRHKVLFFRDQTHLDDAGQEAFAERLGQPQAHPTVPVRDGTRYLLELNSEHGGRANSWHTDVTFLPAYPKASILRAVTSPACPSRCATWPASFGPSTPTPTTMRRPSRTPGARMSSAIATSSPPPSTKPSTQWSASTPSPASAPWCWAISSRL